MHFSYYICGGIMLQSDTTLYSPKMVPLEALKKYYFILY